MSKKCRLAVPFNKQQGKRARTQFQSERRQFYKICWLLFRQLSLKKSLWVICKILRPFVNTFAAHHKYSVLNKQHLLHLIHMQLTPKQKTFSEFFSAFSKSGWNFEHIQKKRWHSSLMVFRNYALQKTRLDKYEKSTASE